MKVCPLGLSERVVNSLALIFQKQLAGSCVLANEADAQVAIIDVDNPGAQAHIDRQQQQFPGRQVILLAFASDHPVSANAILLKKPLKVDDFVQTLKALTTRIAQQNQKPQEKPAIRPMPRESRMAPSPAAKPDFVAPAQAEPTQKDIRRKESLEQEVRATPHAAPQTEADRGGTVSAGGISPVSAVAKVNNIVATDSDDKESPQGPANAARSNTETDVAVAQLNAREKHYYIGSMPDVDLSDAEQRVAVFYDVEQFLQGFVQKAIELSQRNNAPVRVSGAAIGQIDIFTREKKVRTHATAATFQAACRIRLRTKDIEFSVMYDAELPAEADEGVESLEAFLWKIALWASRGRLPAGTELDVPVALKQWPNFPRLLVPPHATRIVGLWARRPTSLAETPGLLGLPQRNVFSLYSACASLGLIVHDRRSIPRQFVPEIEAPTEKRNLFKMLLNKLTKSREA